MTQLNLTPTTANPTPPTPSRVTLGLYLAGLIVTVAGLLFALADRALIGGLDRHLHAIYDPIGKYGEPTPLYVYLATVGVLGVLTWLASLRLVRRRSRWARTWSISILVLSLLVVGPLFLQEYGRFVIPLQLSVFPAAAWLLGLVGVLTLRSPRRQEGATS